LLPSGAAAAAFQEIPFLCAGLLALLPSGAAADIVHVSPSFEQLLYINRAASCRKDSELQAKIKEIVSVIYYDLLLEN